VTSKDDIREFLVSRRAKVTPEQAGLPAYGRNRRVTGLRREEAAMLAGISVEYYTRLERGNTAGASDEVLEAISRALQLDEAERTHLFDLVRTATSPVRRRPSREQVRPVIQQVLDSMSHTPAYVRNGRLDLLASNPLGAALYSPVLDSPVVVGSSGPPNSARYLFLDPRAAEFFCDWDTIANDAVAILRAEAGRDPYDKRLTDLIGELSTLSEEFRVRWAAHNVKLHRSGTKRFHHPLVGDLTFAFEAFDLTADPGQRMLAYTVEPGSASQDALNLLASWSAASPVDEPPAPTGERRHAAGGAEMAAGDRSD
jgi:MmyB-like transcription regulator ligand binding domain/Helix-turn-helix domain